MQVFKETIVRRSFGMLTAVPQSIENQCGAPSVLSFANGESCCATCLNCQNPRCMWFTEQDVTCSAVADFPGDRSLEVCPVGAIAWDQQSEVPVIDHNKCIECGLCIRRCPVGALYFDEGVSINSSGNDATISVPANHTTASAQEDLLQTLIAVGKQGSTIRESDGLMELVYSRMASVRSNDQNTVVRNLLIGLGCTCAMRRIGDVYTRMDAIYTSQTGAFGAVEVEFGRDTLDASRGVLDDIAVLNTRYSIPKNANKALVVCLQLPNARQGYWQVVRDIRIVEGICISTVSIGALLLLLWNGKSFDPNSASFYVDYDNMDVRSIIEHQIGRRVEIADKHLGILEPIK